MLVMADDFTGALDTGIQFAKSGAVTRVVTDPDCDFAKEQVQVLVIDKETRHRPPQEAAEITQGIVERAVESGIRVFYTKTDSALRGNAGAEIEAMLRASGGTCVHFLPALPAMDRVVRGGVLYIGGLPAAESVFGKDPFEPITESAVPAILARQCGAPVCVRDCAQAEDDGEGIIVYNAETKEELDEAAAALARKIREEDGPVLMAGCAGLAASLGRSLSYGTFAPGIPAHRPGFLMISGSVNEVTCRQIRAARAAGFGYRRLDNREKLTDLLSRPEGAEKVDALLAAVSANSCFIIDTCDSQDEERAADAGAKLGMDVWTVGSTIAETLAGLAGEIIARCPERILLLTGGDVLFHTMTRMGITALAPLAEVSPGVILTEFTVRGKRQYVLTKSGGFGDEQLLLRLGRMFADNKEDEK